MKILESVKSKRGNKIQLLSNDNFKPVLIIGVFHGEEFQGKLLKNYFY